MKRTAKILVQIVVILLTPYMAASQHDANSILSYCSATGGCDEYISIVQFVTINNPSGCTGYGNYTSISTDVEKGLSYLITITNGNPIWTLDQCGIWVDWNQNEDLSDDGSISVNGSPGVGPYSANITVPGNAEIGPTRMRIRIVYSTAPSPCGASTFGECEDYTINVFNNCSITSLVFSSAGAYYTTTNSSLSMTIGESVIETYIAQDNTLNTGFQQSETFIPLTRTWNGNFDDNWSVASNWSDNSVPVSIDNVIIPFPAPVMPVVRITGLSCRSVTLQTGASLQVDPGVILRICN